MAVPLSRIDLTSRTPSPTGRGSDPAEYLAPSATKGDLSVGCISWSARRPRKNNNAGQRARTTPSLIAGRSFLLRNARCNDSGTRVYVLGYFYFRRGGPRLSHEARCLTTGETFRMNPVFVAGAARSHAALSNDRVSRAGLVLLVMS